MDPVQKQEILARHETALKSYIEKVNRGQSGYFAVEQTPYISILDTARTYYVFMSYAIDHVDMGAGPHEPLTVYAKAAETLAGIECCLRNGFISSACILLRGLFETVITLTLLTENKHDMVQRSHLYAEYDKVTRWYDMKNHEELVREGKRSQSDFDSQFPPARVKSITDEYNLVKANYHPSQPGTYGWAWKIFATKTKPNNPSIKTICKHLDRLAQYNVLYATLSPIAHAGFIGRKALTAQDGTLSPGPLFDQRTKMLMKMALLFCGRALADIETHIPSPRHEELQMYSEFVLYKTVLAHSEEGDSL